MKTEQVSEVRLEVERVFGKKILSSVDCHELGDHIFQKTGFKLSFNTLRRFFHLMRAEFSPSASTLNILAKYCDYSSFNHYLAAKQHGVKRPDKPQDAKLLEYLISLFQGVEVKHDNDGTYVSMIRQTINFLNFLNYPSDLLDQFQREIAKTKNGQTFYFECFVNTDKLNSFYGNGLKYYLRQKRSAEAQLFGHSLLCLRSWLTDNKEDVETHYKEVLKYKVDDAVHPFVCARFFATQLYRANIANGQKDAILIRARMFYDQIKSDRNKRSLLPCFALNLTEALLLTGENSEALHYAEEAIKFYDGRTNASVDEKAFEAFPLYRALALARLGETAKAKKVFQTIRPERFYFLSRQYHSILYILLKELIQKSKTERNRLASLVKETGFVKLLSFFPADRGDREANFKSGQKWATK